MLKLNKLIEHSNNVKKFLSSGIIIFYDKHVLNVFHLNVTNTFLACYNNKIGFFYTNYKKIEKTEYR